MIATFFGKKLYPLCPALHKIIGAECMRIMHLPEVGGSKEIQRQKALEELWVAKPMPNETPIEWAERNSKWFQCHVAFEYRPGFWADVELAGEEDYQNSAK